MVELTISQQVKRKIFKQFVLAGILLGLLYIYLYYGADGSWHYLVGAVCGILIALVLAHLELNIFARGARKLKFIWLLILRTTLYISLVAVIIFNVTVIARIFRPDFPSSYLAVIQDVRFYKGYLLEGDFRVALFYTIILAFSVNFVRMVSRKMGQGMLVSYLSGTYYEPVHQARVVMFVNVVGAKQLVRDLGPLTFHKFLNHLFYDLSAAIISNKGIIYEYVEDLMVITWSVDKGLENANCIRAYFDMLSTVNEKKENYIAEFGFVPKLQAGLHIGSVVRAEIGEVKTQIVFHGDTMNTTARILAKCKEENFGLLASDLISRMIRLPAIYTERNIGEIDLKGKQEPVKLMQIVDETLNNG